MDQLGIYNSPCTSSMTSVQIRMVYLTVIGARLECVELDIGYVIWSVCCPKEQKVPPFLFLREKLVQSSNDRIRYQNYRYRRADSASSGQYTGNGRFEGFILDLLERIRSVIRGIDFEYEVELVPDGKYGAPGIYSRIWDGMVGEVVRGKADVVAGPLTVTGSRKAAVDFSLPFMSSGVQALTLHPNYIKHNPFRIIYPFTVEVWFINFIIFCLTAIMLYAFNRVDPYEWKATADKEMTLEENANNFTFKNSLWFCASTLFLQSRDASPRSNAGRCIAGFWWFFVLIVMFLYLTNMMFFVTSNKRLAFVQSKSDLKAQKTVKYGTVKGDDTYHVMKTTSSLRGFWHKMNNDHANVYAKTIQEGVQRIRDSNGRYALLGNSPQINYIASQKPCDLKVAGAYLARTQYAFAVAKDSPLAEHISSAMEALRDNGVLEDLVRDWWDLEDKRHRCRNLTRWERSGAYSFEVNDVSGFYYMLVIGIGVSAIAFLAELLYFKFKEDGTDLRRERGATQTGRYMLTGGGIGGGIGVGVGSDNNDRGAKAGGGNMWI